MAAVRTNTATATQPPPSGTAVSAALHAAMWAMRTHQRKALVESGLTGPQVGVLWFLYEYKSLSLSRLAELQMNTPANMTGVVKRLERDGFVTRRRHDKDSRIQMITLTERGEAATKKARKDMEKAMAELFDDCAPDDVTAMLRVLEQVRQRAEAANPKA